MRARVWGFSGLGSRRGFRICSLFSLQRQGSRVGLLLGNEGMEKKIGAMEMVLSWATTRLGGKSSEFRVLRAKGLELKACGLPILLGVLLIAKR